MYFVKNLARVGLRKYASETAAQKLTVNLTVPHAVSHPVTLEEVILLELCVFPKEVVPCIPGSICTNLN